MDEKSRARLRRQRAWLGLTAFALVLAFAAVIGATAAFVHQSLESEEHAARQVVLNEDLRQVQSLLVTLNAGESAERGYLLTGDPSYRTAYQTAAERNAQIQRSLDALSSVNAGLGLRIAQLQALTARAFGEMDETLRVRERQGIEEATRRMQTNSARQYPIEIASSAKAVLDEVRVERDALNLAQANTSASSRYLATGTVSSLFVFMCLTGLQILLLVKSRRRYETELALSERRHREIVEEQSELIAVVDTSGILRYVNPAFKRHFGEAGEVGKTVYDLVSAEDRQASRANFGTVLRTGETRLSERWMVLADGERRWIAWVTRVQIGDDGERMSYTVGRDITSRKEAEDALQASKDFLARTGKAAGVGGWQLDLVTNELSWTDQTFRIHEMAVGSDISVEAALGFYPPEARLDIQSALERCRQFGESYELELPLITAKGRLIWVRTVGECDIGTRGTARRIAGALQDVTSRKLLERELEEREQFIRKITDNLPIRIGYVDRELRFRFVNEANVQRFGKSREDILGRTRSELTGGSTDAVVEPHVALALAGKKQRFEMDDEVGSAIHQFECQLIPDVDATGATIGFFTISIDINDRKSQERALRELTEIFDSTSDMVVQTDWRGQVVYMNPSARRALGFSATETLSHHSFSEFNTPETNVLFQQEITATVKKQGMWIGEATVILVEGQVVPVSHMVIAHRDTTGRVARYSAIMRDITRDVEARHQLTLQTGTLRSIIDAMPTMVAVFSPDLRYRLINTAFEQWKNLRRDDVVGKFARDVLGEEDHDRSLPFALRALAGETVTFEKEFSDGLMRHVSMRYLPLRLEDGRISGMIGIGQDMTTHREKEASLLQLSERDPLTGVLNRSGFERIMDHEVATGDPSRLAVLFIDLDRFKPVNDAYGHAVGDKLLVEFAGRLRASVRPTDGVARLGGDEFAICLFGVRESTDAVAIGDKVVAIAREPFHIDGLTITVGASVGVAIGAEHQRGWQQLLERADAQVYEAKAAGRGRHSLEGAT